MTLPDAQNVLEAEDKIGIKFQWKKKDEGRKYENTEHKIRQGFKNSMETTNNTRRPEEWEKTFSFLPGGGYN